MRKNHSPGCPCCEAGPCPAPNYQVEVFDCCDVPELGATVTVARITSTDPYTTTPAGSAVTDSDGIAVFNLPPGDYTIDIQAASYAATRTVTITGCELTGTDVHRPDCCVAAWPGPPTLTTPWGDIPMTLPVFAQPDEIFVAEQVVSVTGATAAPTILECDSPTGTIECRISYSLQCLPDVWAGGHRVEGSLRLSMSYIACGASEAVLASHGITSPQSTLPTPVLNGVGGPGLGEAGWSSTEFGNWHYEGSTDQMGLCRLDCREPATVPFDLDFTAFGEAGGASVVWGPATPAAAGPGTATLTVRVHAPDCEGTPGAPISGATVELVAGIDPLPAAGTTDAEGLASFPDLPTDRTYRVRAMLGDCGPVERDVYLGACATETETNLTLCCGAVRVTVVSSLAPYGPVPSAQVRRQGDTTWTDADVSGQALLELTTEEMLGLAVSGADCSTRLLPIEARSTATPGWLNWCTTVEVECGSTAASPTEVEIPLEPLDRDGDDIADLADSGGLCPDYGCEEPGPALRGEVPDHPTVVLEAEVQDGGTWYNLLDAVGGSARVFNLNVPVRDGTPDPSSPFEDETRFFYIPRPAIEYLSGPISISADMPEAVTGFTCSSPFHTLRAWMRSSDSGGASGVIVRLYGGGSAVRYLPTDGVPCPEEVEYLQVEMFYGFSACIVDWPMTPIDSGVVTLEGAAGGRDFRFRFQLTA